MFFLKVQTLKTNKLMTDEERRTLKINHDVTSCRFESVASSS